jgi:serine phosphatase RsbU (regulator of sigma subunit)
VLTSTTQQIPLAGAVDNAPLAAGASPWLISVKARRPLVGSVAMASPWFVLGAGVLGSLLVAAIVEAAARRRDTALALYASEHKMAETLQRSLLSELPAVPGLRLAARYLAAESGQEVGGDWFDAFPIGNGQIGIAIGDVMGHDLAAASAMAQIRAGLRAYAVDGDSPATVMNRLDRLVAAFEITPLVTVIYGIVDLPAPDGSRMLRFANAGHLPPLLRRPDGSVTPLGDGVSVLIGTPIQPDHSEATYRLPPGSTLLLFTDGLVEVPSRPIEDTLAELADHVAAVDPAADVETICGQVVAGAADTRRDDIALLAVQVVPPAAEPDGYDARPEPEALRG